jgi:hypothetical protein
MSRMPSPLILPRQLTLRLDAPEPPPQPRCLDRSLLEARGYLGAHEDDALPPALRIGWMRIQRVARRTLRLGVAALRDHEIRIHPVLAHGDIPPWMLDWVVWHEVCHFVRPPVVHAGRRAIHHDAFEALVRRHPFHERAEQWERHHRDLLFALASRV